ncbi:Adenylate cyclase [Marinobacterium lacunae]|uniref:Adenylate cyclase n=1 Tax=Marinobacterium lacunae TaxID=1232683 RepID=A0A081FUX5_9GAMM|nr:adenylate/guanylate cyclase domain-containing protein [Marinobacterium lacunae]KEA62330.1 Adenylate cyclase [Marinobacterium lacunae]MBR9882616.1 HAMP domain-containing protein [Oceanospirillales bacterium]
MKNIRVSVAHLLVALFGLLIIVGFSSLGYVAVRESRASLIEQLTQFADSSMNNINGKLVDRLSPVEYQLRYLAQKDVTEVVDSRDYRRLGRMLNSALAATPQVLGLGFMGAEGVLTYSNRDSRQVMIGEWRQRSMSQIRYYLRNPPEDLVWMEPQWSSSLGRSIIPALMPVSYEGKFLGLFIAVIAIDDLSQFLADLQMEFDGVPFVLQDYSYRVIAYPGMLDQMEVKLKPGLYLPQMDELNDPVLSALANGKDEIFHLIKSSGLASRQVSVDGVQYVVLYRTLSGGSLPAWTVGTYFSWDVVSDSIQRVYMLLAAALALLVTMLIGAILLSRRVSRAVNRIVLAFDRVAHDDVYQVPLLAGSHITELDRIASAFNLMINSLRDYQSVKSQFVRYVPDPVVESLRKSRGVLEPQEVEATILFCDLQDFTALSQQVAPSDIVKILNSYFTVVAELLEEAGGVITQFQGDAVLASFNVPISLENHAERAVEAAKAIIESVDRQTFNGHSLNCRIGICTGPVIAGVVGAKARVNYTVHGDTVNMSARLEQMNKEYGTRILVAESTASRVSSVAMEFVAESQIRGREGGIKLYTLNNSASIPKASAVIQGAGNSAP